jgi:predicted nucleotidyltransferase
MKNDVPADLRLQCAWALQEQLGVIAEITPAFVGWLEVSEPKMLRRVAAQALANAIASDEVPWDYRVVELVEELLMGLEGPCPHALRSLEGLATAREIRRGLRLEGVLRDALKTAGGHIHIAFVFGSTARKRQAMDSDIDLMVIGDVRLRELSTPLRDAERTLGRRIQLALYTRDVFCERFQSGDPFLIDVCRREKLPVIIAGASVVEKDIDDELRAMVAERVAPTT